MNKKILLGSIIAVVILVLVSFSNVVAKVLSDDELVEFDVEFSGLGKKHTVELTQQEADEVELLFDEIHERLNEVETRDEAEEILKDAVVELDKYGLLGGLAVKQAQRLVTGKYQKSLESKYKEKSLNEKDILNKNCIFVGDFIGAQDMRNIFYLLGIGPVLLGAIFSLLFFPFGLILSIALKLLTNVFAFIFLTIGFSLMAYGNIKPLHLFDLIHMDKYVPSQVKSFISYGEMGRQNYTSPDDWWFMGIDGFTGISIVINLNPLEEIYLGSAVYVHATLI